MHTECIEIVSYVRNNVLTGTSVKRLNVHVFVTNTYNMDTFFRESIDYEYLNGLLSLQLYF